MKSIYNLILTQKKRQQIDKPKHKLTAAQFPLVVRMYTKNDVYLTLLEMHVFVNLK